VRVDAVFIAGGGSGPCLIWARSGPWLRLRRQLDTTHCVAFSSTIIPAGVTGSVGAAGLANDGGGLFWRQDEDLSTGVHHWALYAWRLPARMGFGHAHSCFLSDRLVSMGALRSSVSFYHHVARFLGPW
jgi:hypothetical protein